MTNPKDDGGAAEEMFPRPTRSNADEWLVFLSEYLDNRAGFPSGLPFVAVQICNAIEDELRWARDEIIRLCEATEESQSSVIIGANDLTENFAQGRHYEAKGIRRTMANVIDDQIRSPAMLAERNKTDDR